MSTATPRNASSSNASAHLPHTYPHRSLTVRPRPVEWLCERPKLGTYLRRRREALGLTQEQVAHATAISIHTIRKCEAGERNPSIASLQAWCDVLDLPDWTHRKIASLLLGRLDTLQAGIGPYIASPDDLAHLEMSTGPAFCVRFPHYDVLAANSAARAMAPDITFANPSHAGSINLVEWLMSPAAKALIANWEECAGRAVFLLRVMGPGIVPAHRLNQIFTTCNALAPNEFPRLFAAELDKAAIGRDVVLLRNTGNVDEYTYRYLRSTQPARPYEHLQLAKRTHSHTTAERD